MMVILEEYRHGSTKQQLHSRKCRKKSKSVVNRRVDNTKSVAFVFLQGTATTNRAVVSRGRLMLYDTQAVVLYSSNTLSNNQFQSF